MEPLFAELLRALQSGEGVVAATIVASSGSTPRPAGSRMLLYRDGRSAGSIGGGRVEADVMAAARALFDTPGALILSHDISNAAAGQMDLICGGRMQVLLEYVAPDAQNLAIYRLLGDRNAPDAPHVLIGSLRGNANPYQLTRMVLESDGRGIGPLQADEALLQAIAQHTPRRGACSLLRTGDQHAVIEVIQTATPLYLIGGGHLAMAVAELVPRLSFRIIVIDDRPEFASKERFPEAEEVVVCPGFQNLFAKQQITERAYLLIVTRGHGFDKEALAQALATRAGYIGMIGSRTKRTQIYRALEEEGIAPSELQRVHCPVGLAIDAETPEEIAISIAAQLIQHRAAQRRNG